MKKINLPKWKTSYTKLDLSLLESCFIPEAKISTRRFAEIYFSNDKKNVDTPKNRAMLSRMQVRDGQDITRALGGVITDLLNRGDAESEIMANVLQRAQFVIYATNTKLESPQKFNHEDEIAHADRLFQIHSRGKK